MGTNSTKGMTSRKILDEPLLLQTALPASNENCKVILSQPVTQVDDGKACLIISKISYLLQELDIPIVKNRDINKDDLGSKGFYLNPHGIAKFKIDLKESVRKL